MPPRMTRSTLIVLGFCLLVMWCCSITAAIKSPADPMRYLWPPIAATLFHLTIMLTLHSRLSAK